MNSPQFKLGNTAIFNHKVTIEELTTINPVSVVGLYTSEALLSTGVILILLNNFNVISPGDYFGQANWVTMTIFTIGLCINFISIPFLYFSSFANFRKECDFWDKEIFWILPLFFFGTYFLYNSFVHSALLLLFVSIVFISLVHVFSMLKAQKIRKKESQGSLSNKASYMTSLGYLSIYYLLFLLLMLVVDPLRKIYELINPAL
ncbi:MAG: hypothetical protein WCI36_02870 [bacterium]